MKITICGSLKFFEKMKGIEKKLVNQGHLIILPVKFQDTDYDNKKISDGVRNIISNNAITEHYKKILQSDAILVANYDKKGISNYIGGNTFLEMGFAYVNDKKIFVLNPLPTTGLNYLEELLGMQPVILNGDLTKIPKKIK
jgi:hypothetical protein